MPQTVSISTRLGRSLRLPPSRLALALVAVALAGCGLESDGSHKQAAPSQSSEAAGADASQLGRYQTESVRLGVTRPLFLLIDTATGLVLQREILSAQRFRPITDEPAPGADLEPKLRGRYDVKVVPGRRGSALLRLDTVTGETWFNQLSSSQRQWYVIPNTLDEEPQKPAALRTLDNARKPSLPAGAAAPARGAGGQGEAKKKPPLDSLVEVVTKPEYQTDLRVWTAGFMAGLYPAEALELVSSGLGSDNPALAVAIVEGLELDHAGELRKALNSLRDHPDPTVAEAVRLKLVGSD